MYNEKQKTTSLSASAVCFFSFFLSVNIKSCLGVILKRNNYNILYNCYIILSCLTRQSPTTNAEVGASNLLSIFRRIRVVRVLAPW